ncbi:hypothetical protein QP519_10685 [Weeksella virosa]|uniref:hypothetical protein n=1 Tax=Weeksella virosa TaxID=1014 RepID=UPI002556346E|nr:hypothetical protein [Weeksella virosa]MDK7376000.1 hypothetical protein [Weeksella virosa]
MMIVSQVDGLFQIDLSSKRINITEENNWFTTNIVNGYSLPEELPYSIDPFFLRYKSDNAEDYETEFDVIFNDFGKLHSAKFEIISLFDNTFEFSLFYGFETFPNWENKLTELDFPLIATNNIREYAKEINSKFYPEENIYFPCIHTDQYPQSELNYANFKGSFNLMENGEFVENTIDVENNVVYNLTIIRPNLYWLYLLKTIINQAGFSLSGDIVNDKKLEKLLVGTSRKYVQTDRPESIEWIIGLESYIREGFRHRLGKGWQYGRWVAEQEILHFGKFRMRGLIHNWGRKHHDVRAFIYLDGQLIFSRSGRQSYDVNVEFTTKKGGSKLEIYAYDYHRSSEKAELKIIPIEVYNEDGSIIDFVIDSQVIDLKNSLPDTTQGEFIETTMKWFNYDFTVNGNNVTMNKVERILRRKRDADNWEDFEAHSKERRTDSVDSFLIKFKDQANDKYKFQEAFISKSGIQTENIKINDNTEEIIINAIPLPVTSRNNLLSATIINDDDAMIFGILRNDSTTTNYTLEMTDFLIPNVYEVDYKAFLRFRILTLQYMWHFNCYTTELLDFDIKKEKFCYNNNHFVKKITREKYQGKEEVDVETYLIR